MGFGGYLVKKETTQPGFRPSLATLWQRWPAGVVAFSDGGAFAIPGDCQS
jgi:hypothetical protein